MSYLLAGFLGTIGVILTLVVGVMILVFYLKGKKKIKKELIEEYLRECEVDENYTEAIKIRDILKAYTKDHYPEELNDYKVKTDLFVNVCNMTGKIEITEKKQLKPKEVEDEKFEDEGIVV